MTARLVKLFCRSFGFQIPERFLPGRAVTFTATERSHLAAAYGQETADQW